ncbi:tetratricopeptide repeat protein, partial [bacterium]|nr:tetratricopeptide repeat protein [bacterium]
MPRRRRYLRTHSFREAARAFLEPEPEAAGESLARLSISEVVRALHAGEDLARLSGLLQTAIGAQSELPPPGESLAPPVDGGASGPASIQRPLRMASPRPTRMRTLAARIVKLASGPTKQVREAIPEDALERLLDGPERDIEIARGALLVAREDEPKLDVGRSLDRIGKLARSLKERLAKASPDPWERLAVMNDFFFDDEGFRAEAIVDPERRLDDLHLARVLARRRGHCLGLSVLYLALGDRAGLPLFGVSCPRHFFVRYDDGKGTRINLEMTLQGASTPDSYYMERYRISPLHVDQGLYLGNLAKKQVLVELLNNRANCYWDQGDAARASRDLDRVARASRSFAPGFFARGFLAFEKGDVSTAVSELRRAIAIDPFYTRAYLHLAYAYLKAGSLEKAEVELVRAIDLDPQSALAHTNLGRVHARRGKQEAAIASHRKALELDP